MTKEQKIEWLENASAEKLLQQMVTSVKWMQYESERDFLKEIEHAEDVELVKAEILKRINQ